ncbi:MAG: hypothetical protein FWH35_10635, partial [Treponema sp.]|nr:hypothetical protein [Treponema sp.]
ILAVISIVIGFIVKSFFANTVGIPELSGIAGFLAGGIIFLIGSPIMLISGFIDDKIDRTQDREDYRQMMADINADLRAEEHELAEDKRMDRYINSLGKSSKTNIYIDNRQIHINNPKPRTSKKKLPKE